VADVITQVRVVVIGGGVVGAAAAWQLARRGHQVTLLEQFAAGHHHGASHGTSRIFRHAYTDPTYIDLAARGLRGWQRLERTTGVDVFERTGAVDHGDPATVQQLAQSLRRAGLEFHIMSPAGAVRRWPGIRFDTVVLHHADAGRLHADRAVDALWQAARLAGADLREHTPVREIRTRANGLDVVLDDDVLRPDQLVVAAGAWTERLLSGRARLPQLRTTQEQPAHFAHSIELARWPSFIHHPGAELTTPGGIYGLGSADGIKIGEHGTGAQVDPDDRDYRPDPAGVQRLRTYAHAWLPGVDADSADPLTCLYTTTPDHNFVIDRVGSITVAAGFSGHGFKFGPALGDLVVDLVESRRPGIELFSLARERVPTQLAG
jgi:sarcosine oxidase